MSTITYRPATVGDAPAIARTEVRSKRESIPGLESEQSMNYDWSFERWSGYIAGTRHPQLAAKQRMIYVACDGEDVVGYIGCHHTNGSKDWWLASSELQQIYILKSYQRQGIGTKLFKTIVCWLRETGINSLGVGYHAANPYRAFYDKMGGESPASGVSYWHDLSNWAPPE